MKCLKMERLSFHTGGKSFTTITGLDPLGLQIASEKIYSYLLQGITNLTNRIRYYGFYCWVLNKYIEPYDGKITQQSHRRFIRRAELLIALIMMKSDPEASQIKGSRKAREILSEIGTKETINIAKYADDRQSEDAYWKYATGAFGQYYSASIKQIGLIREDMVSNNHHVHMITEKVERSLLYVASTRAKKQVFVSSYRKKSRFLKNYDTNEGNI